MMSEANDKFSFRNIQILPGLKIKSTCLPSVSSSPSLFPACCTFLHFYKYKIQLLWVFFLI